ncbi:hydrolase YhcX [Devosia pacifica]|uniref:Hydrolase YhcX n=1 Tax=Devosia pacifica TaxID=1335967 RepID=A0A918S4Q6_9HYPH|nr:carbon-nitrogen hydrolase family protein [Devosia pacifica]GHA23899.1 hydrolase YhcX [Devosia pacifica]
MPELTGKPILEVRNAEIADIPGILDLTRRVYPEESAYLPGSIRGQIHAFPEGQFVAVFDGEIVGYAATLQVAESQIFRQHTWVDITGGGYASPHNGKGEWLYGVEVCVDPGRRRAKIGKRLYEVRQRLCEEMQLKGIAFGGRIPGFRRHRKDYSDPAAYVAAVREREVRDPVASFQMKLGFEPVMALRNYHTEDRASGGHAALMIWHNPYYDPHEIGQPISHRGRETVRVTTVQLGARWVRDHDDFFAHIRYFVEVAADYGSDFVVFPELFTLLLLSSEPQLAPHDAIRRLTEFTPEFVERMQQMALALNINIIGGSHPTITDDGDIQNVSYVFLRDGTIHAQEKLHPTPDERDSWGTVGGDAIDVIDTDCGPIGVMICYDSEFPELARRLADQGARILFVPFCTDTRHGHLRVRFCSQARAIENQCYVVTSGITGNLANVDNLDINYAQSAILTPCDMPFARDGIAAECSENVEMVAVADLNLATVRWARAQGAVRNLRDRRFDLYRVRWWDGG